MSNQTVNPPPVNSEQEPFIPPYYMLILAVVGFTVALIVLLTQPTFSVVGWGGLGIGLLSLVVWGFMAPDQARAILTGRTARYGGTTVLVTVIFIVALIAIYSLVKSRNIRLDLTERNDFSLTEENRQIIQGLAVEPNIPNVKIYAFYGQNQGSARDQAVILLDEYVQASQNKITYEFVDPDRNPNLAQTYEITRTGQIAVLPLDAEGNPINDRLQKVDFLTQEALSNAILRVAASGDFRAYVIVTDSGITLEGAGSSGMSELNNLLKEQFNWKTDEVSFVQLAATGGDINLSDPAVDGQVVVIVGGDTPLNQQQVDFLTNYLNNGGHVVIFAAPVKSDNQPVLATTPALSEYLFNTFGLRFVDNLVMDQTLLADQYGFLPGANTFDKTSPITRNLNEGTPMVLSLPRSIEVAPTLPQNVVVTELVKTSDQSYAKLDTSILTATDIALTRPTDADPKGPFVVGASAENTQTGARLVLFGSADIATNQWRGGGVSNLSVALLSLAWTTKFDDFFQEIPQLTQPQRAEDQPIFATQQVLRNINFVTIIVLPFSVLLLGAYAWWRSRERAR
jgi:ABC-type uncharacterized transport system involved in gliding motility auxiliary subunit